LYYTPFEDKRQYLKKATKRKKREEERGRILTTENL